MSDAIFHRAGLKLIASEVLFCLVDSSIAFNNAMAALSIHAGVMNLAFGIAVEFALFWTHGLHAFNKGRRLAFYLCYLAPMVFNCSLFIAKGAALIGVNI